jgi:hypothetical protein
VKSDKHDYIYQAFGLIIGSGIEIPGLLRAKGEPDVGYFFARQLFKENKKLDIVIFFVHNAVQHGVFCK